jgi:hypothetical protein
VFIKFGIRDIAYGFLLHFKAFVDVSPTSTAIYRQTVQQVRVNEGII